MAINRESSNDTAIRLRIKRDGKYVANKNGATDLQDFVMACTVQEGIDSAAIQAQIVIQDSAGLINTLTGSESWEILFQTGNNEAVYNLYAYNIDSRARNGQSEAYIVECVSIEFLVNEATNIFGSAKKLYQKELKSKNIVEKILKETIGTRKSVFAEDSKNNHNFIATNWRAFDTIYWLAQKSVRSKSPGNNPQNGFLFFENRFGYHFKSVDMLIDEINQQSYSGKSNNKTGKAILYKYTYSQKKSGDEGNDDMRIDSISFPEDRNYLSRLRNGSYTGWSAAFDPSDFANSKLSQDTFAALQYNMSNNDGIWKSMSHLGGGKNPIEFYGNDIKKLMSTPKRIRYGVMPNRIYENTKTTNASQAKTQYNELPYLQSYQHLRIESLKSIQLLVNIPGNLDLYCGYGVEIDIPMTRPKGDKIERDRKYSGKYLISGIRHKYDGRSLTTEMLLYKDSIPKS